MLGHLEELGRSCPRSPSRVPRIIPVDAIETRVDLLNHIYRLSGNPLHGTAGVGKSAIEFTVAGRMRGLKATEQTTREKRLVATFFFSHEYTNRCTTGDLFATFVYQLATNFPSIGDDVNWTIYENPALLDFDTSLQDQMEALFLQPLRRLRLRLRECPPLVFALDALDVHPKLRLLVSYPCLAKLYVHLIFQ